MHRAPYPSIPVASAAGGAGVPTASFSFHQRCVLCVGGLTGARNHYRVAIEAHQGRFLHHDGGREDSLHRLQPMLNGADLVVCASGNISHNAYHLVKQLCKKMGKPCVMIKGTGIASFIEGLSSLSGRVQASQRGETVLKSGRPN
jgi:hypothetical protein